MRRRAGRAEDGEPTTFGQQAAAYAHRTLQATRPADRPIEQPTPFGIVLSLESTRVLGLTILHSVLRQATETIQ